jgi:hypothetical protein
MTTALVTERKRIMMIQEYRSGWECESTYDYDGSLIAARNAARADLKEYITSGHGPCRLKLVRRYPVVAHVGPGGRAVGIEVGDSMRKALGKLRTYYTTTPTVRRVFTGRFIIALEDDTRLDVEDDYSGIYAARWQGAKQTARYEIKAYSPGFAPEVYGES